MIQPLGPFAGEWCDVDHDPATGGLIFAALERPGIVTVQRWKNGEGGAVRDYHLGRWALYLRAAADGTGNVCVVLQDGRDRNPVTGDFYPAIVVLFPVDGSPREIACPAGPAFGQNAVQVISAGIDGFWVGIVTSPETWWLGQLSPGGTWGTVLHQRWARTSQGFADVFERMDDARDDVPGMVCPSSQAGISIGQNADAGPDRIRGLHAGVYFTAIPGTAYEPHLASDGRGRWLACARTPQGAALVALAPPFEPEQAPPNPPEPLPDVPWQTDPHGVVEDIWPWIATNCTALSPDGRVAWMLKSDERNVEGQTHGEHWDADDQYIGHLEDSSRGDRIYQGRLVNAIQWVQMGEPVPWFTLPLARNTFKDGARLWLPRRCVSGYRQRYVTDISWNNGLVWRGVPVEIRVDVGYGRFGGREAFVRGVYSPEGHDEENWFGPTGWVRHVPAGSTT